MLYFLDSRNGTLLTQFGGDVVPSFTPSPSTQPASAAASGSGSTSGRTFTRFNYLHAFLVAPLTDSSIVTVVAWMQLGPPVNSSSSNSSGSPLLSASEEGDEADGSLPQQQELIVFRLLIAPGNLTVNDGGSDGGNYQTMLSPPLPGEFARPQAYYASHSLNSERLYVRVEGEQGGAPNLFLVDNRRVWTAGVDRLSFPLATFLIDSTDPACRYVVPSQLVSNARLGGALLLPVLDTQAPSGPPSQTFALDFSGVFPEAAEAERPFHLLFDPSVAMQLLLVGSARMVAVQLHLNPPLGPPVPPMHLVWSFARFEHWSAQSADGQPQGRMGVEAWASIPDFQRLVSVSLLPDMQSNTQLLLVHTNSTAQFPAQGGRPDGGFLETLWVFTTRPDAPTCNETAYNNCTACEAASGRVTARLCAYCPSTLSCLQIGAVDYESCGDDASFAVAGAVCESPPSTPNPEVLSTFGLVMLLLAIGASLVAALVMLVRRSRARTRSLQLDETLRDTYHALSPDAIMCSGANSGAGAGVGAVGSLNGGLGVAPVDHRPIGGGREYERELGINNAGNSPSATSSLSKQRIVTNAYFSDE